MLLISLISTFYQLQRQQEAVEKTIRNGAFQPPVEPTVTPKSFPRVKPAYVFKYDFKFLTSTWSLVPKFSLTSNRGLPKLRSGKSWLSGLMVNMFTLHMKDL